MLLRLSVIVLLFLTISCNEVAVNNEQSMTAGDSGRQLVKTYCSSCHLAVLPAELDKRSWLRNVLPAMAPRLGIKVWNGNQYFPSEKPLIAFSDWTRLVEYYTREAPDSLPVVATLKMVNGFWRFALEKPSLQTRSVATTVMVAADTIRNLIYSCDSYADLSSWSSSLQFKSAMRLPSPAVQMINGTRTTAFTLIGSMEAVDRPSGRIIEMNLQGSIAEPAAATIIAEQLPRPVQSLPADFNQDGLIDWIVCGFGHEKGMLGLLTQTSSGKFIRSVVSDVPGSLQVQTGDFNGDGWQDFLSLFAHADEGIWLFTNDKKGGFIQKNILRFPPHYGSTSFQLVDINRDGRPDILYSCGDNSDYSRVLKPFHGVYIFLNKGDWSFEQAWFYHVNGCTKAVAADFDGNGQQDIASIAFFADLKNNPAEKFLLFRQDSLMHFTTISPPVEKLGRWISMEVIDTDHDGDKDILLGNYSKGFINQPGALQEWNKYTPFILLRNTK